MTTTVGTAGPEHATGFDGVVEAVRQTVLAAQVAGAVVALDVKVGDAVKTGQVLARIDARAAIQNTAASDAQAMAARASLDMAEVPVALGDMAMPGRPLVTLYDSASLRVTVSVPQSAAVGLQKDAVLRIQLPVQPTDREWVTPSSVVVLPTVDPATHSAQSQLELPHSAPGIASEPVRILEPGLFARVWLPGAVGGTFQARRQHDRRVRDAAS